MRASTASRSPSPIGCERASAFRPAQHVLLAKVNGTEISAGDAAGAQALEKIIDRELLVQQAIAAGLDRDPKVAQSIEDARRSVLAQAWLERAAARLSRSTPEEVREFYAANPALFAERRIYRLRELAVSLPAELFDALRAEAARATDLEEVAAWLRARNARYTAFSSTLPAEQVPLAQLASIRFAPGPDMIKSENARLNSIVYVDVRERDVGSYVDDASRLLDERLDLPAGYRLEWTGQYQYMREANRRLRIMVPIAIAIIFLILWFNFRSVPETLIVMLSLPFALVGSVWLLWLLGYNLSVGVWVGLIALAGLDAQTGVVMLLYLSLSHRRREAEGSMRTAADLEEAIVEGAARRLRPKLMTVLAMTAGLLPLLWSQGVGADLMKRIAAPMVGGLVTSFALELLVYPALFAVWKRRSLLQR